MIIQLLERDDPRAEVLMDMENLPFNAKSELSKANIYICDYSGTDPAYRGPTMVTVCCFGSGCQPEKQGFVGANLFHLGIFLLTCQSGGGAVFIETSSKHPQVVVPENG